MIIQIIAVNIFSILSFIIFRFFLSSLPMFLFFSFLFFFSFFFSTFDSKLKLLMRKRKNRGGHQVIIFGSANNTRKGKNCWKDANETSKRKNKKKRELLFDGCKLKYIFHCLIRDCMRGQFTRGQSRFKINENFYYSHSPFFFSFQSLSSSFHFCRFFFSSFHFNFFFLPNTNCKESVKSAYANNECARIFFDSFFFFVIFFFLFFLHLGSLWVPCSLESNYKDLHNRKAN